MKPLTVIMNYSKAIWACLKNSRLSNKSAIVNQALTQKRWSLRKFKASQKWIPQSNMLPSFFLAFSKQHIYWTLKKKKLAAYKPFV